ncbi:hypothetical protein [Jidongwangia harbinensis]|uniref:hypothetical protein n=1 Tax=Jidongwangia harbinensis TaxID=2878561 RepID=UPI001CD96D8D|nr:hypothetical protein [Jidongwangia harbinensis]MCA2215654.1 hypothetical protein [Jidongwangia harbinensis]
MSPAERDDGGLDELFALGAERAVEEPQPVEEKPRSRFGWLIRNVLLVAVATVVAVAGLRIAGVRISLLIIVAAFIALRLLMLAVSEVAPPPVPRSRSARGEESGAYRWDGADSLRTAVRRWEQRLQWSQSDGDRFSRNVLPVLAELTDERLRLRHGITRSSDPRRARELIGEPMWLLLADPERRAPKAKELAAYVETLERL